jgi:methionine synthase II (cobalamin-independent)
MTSFYLTGSINVPSTEAAFQLVGERLQPGVSRVPDGEPGDRANWVLVHSAHFLSNPTLDVENDRAKVRPGTTVLFSDVDYHSSAIASYTDFRAARDAGILAGESRFLVSIATPFNAVNSFVAFDSQVEVALAYEQALRRSVEKIHDAIPHADLAIQWDLPTELATIEGWFPNPYHDVEPILAATARLARWVQDDVDLTFHLCYGDSKFGASPFMGDAPDEGAAARGGRHILPRDASAIVTLANGLSRHITRRINAIQAATVSTWTKRAHWQPLATLALEPDTEFFLGLVHAEDGAAGARARAAVAAEYLPDFGLSTECGLGRHSTEQLEAVLVAWQELATSREPALITR